MTETRCDRCKQRIGRMKDGGKDEPHFILGAYVKDLAGIPSNYDVCQRCMADLVTAIRGWMETKP